MAEKEIFKHPENSDDYKGLKVNEGISQPEPVSNDSVKRFLKKKRKLLPVKDYVNGILNGDITLLSKAVTLVESANPKHQELAQEIIKATGTSSQIVHRELPVDDPKQRRPDTTLAKKVLDWQARVELAEGLRYTVEYFKQLRKEG